MFGVLGPLEVSAGGRAARVGERASSVGVGGVVGGCKRRGFDGSPGRGVVGRYATSERVELGAEARVSIAFAAGLRVGRGGGDARAGVCGAGGEESLDAERFEGLVADAQAVRQRGDAPGAVGLLDAALALWRGPAFGEFAFAEFARAEAARLEELRWVATEERVEARLTLGAHDELVGELEALVSESGFRERLWGELMLALYRSGRQAEALRAYGRVRSLLGEELGIEPGVALRSLEEAMVLQKPELDWVPAARLAAAASGRVPRQPADPGQLVRGARPGAGGSGPRDR